MSSSWGEKVKISIFGESHSEAIGVVIDGLPAGESIDMEQVLVQMKRRAPGQDKSATTRPEADFPRVVAGLLNGVTEGSPLCAMIENTNTRSGDYNNIISCPRPGHADYTGNVRYGGANDSRGGGHFSGRLTAPLVFAGAIARQILERRGIVIGAHAGAIAGVQDIGFDLTRVSAEQLKSLNSQYFSVIDPEAKREMGVEIERVRLAADSVGGIVECAVTGASAGLGSPMFGGTENVFSSILFGIPAVKAVEFGVGFKVADLRGSQNNDSFYMDGGVKTHTNNCGGILGGITTGMPIVFRVAIKPTASIGTEQDTVNLTEQCNAKITVHGRHDPCIVPRAIPVVEAAAALAMMNLL